jgi:hypothetical protein
MSVERLMVVVQVYGPMLYNGVLGESGITEISGSTDPRELALDDVVGEEFELEEILEIIVEEPELGEEDETVASLVSCLTRRFVVASAEVRAIVLEDRLEVVVGVAEETTGETEAGIATGQKLHTCRVSSQYRSTSNLRKPLANRFERQSAELSSSYRRKGKQAAVRDAPGAVTKLIGTFNPRSLCD